MMNFSNCILVSLRCILDVYVRSGIDEFRLSRRRVFREFWYVNQSSEIIVGECVGRKYNMVKDEILLYLVFRGQGYEKFQ